MINKIILAIALCFLGNNLIAQIGGNQRGLRNQQGLNPVNERIEPNKDTPPDVNVLSQEKADFYQEMIGIDDFQKEVLKMFFKDYYAKSSSIAYDKNLALDEKEDKISAEKELLEKNLLEVFSEEQVETIMTEEQFGSKFRELKKEKRKEKKQKKRKKKRKQ